MGNTHSTFRKLTIALSLLSSTLNGDDLELLRKMQVGIAEVHSKILELQGEIEDRASSWAVKMDRLQIEVDALQAQIRDRQLDISKADNSEEEWQPFTPKPAEPGWTRECVKDAECRATTGGFEYSNKRFVNGTDMVCKPISLGDKLWNDKFCQRTLNGTLRSLEIGTRCQHDSECATGWCNGNKSSWRKPEESMTGECTRHPAQSFIDFKDKHITASFCCKASIFGVTSLALLCAFPATIPCALWVASATGHSVASVKFASTVVAGCGAFVFNVSLGLGGTTAPRGS